MSTLRRFGVAGVSSLLLLSACAATEEDHLEAAEVGTDEGALAPAHNPPCVGSYIGSNGCETWSTIGTWDTGSLTYLPHCIRSVFTQARFSNGWKSTLIGTRWTAGTCGRGSTCAGPICS